MVHPSWCVGEAGGCDGRSHSSRQVVVSGDDRSGIGITASLWQSQGRQTFLGLMVTPVPDDALGLAATGFLAETDAHPEFVTDAHGHDLTISQFEALYAALGYLLAETRRTAPAGQGTTRGPATIGRTRPT
ncbi:hypothetical protein ABT369_19695 [Dactylosporangium sp. NPDC000244]|uniref:hypothetical protein n=1 Tax=Dactylosporangium sp. NPDC000244 TaxID=3154365 RepID=UPI00332A3672